MTDTSIRVEKSTRQRLNSFAGLRDMSQGEAIELLLDMADAPEVPKEQ
jgi:hypothetical protein